MTAELNPRRRAALVTLCSALSLVACATCCLGGAGNSKGLAVKLLSIDEVEANKLDPIASVVTITLDKAVPNDLGYLLLPRAGQESKAPNSEAVGTRWSLVRYTEHRAPGADFEPRATKKIRVVITPKELSSLKDRLPMTAKLYLKKRESKAP